MRIGILVCDHVEEQLRLVHGGYDSMFQTMFETYECEIYFVCDGQFPNDPYECDVWVVGGSHLSVYDNVGWIHELKSFVQSIYQAEKKYVGVCFGHQMLAQALDGKVEKANSGWCLGTQPFDIVEKASWMNPDADQVSVLMLCQDQVVQLPSESRLLAANIHCPVAMYQVGDRMIGIQGHPEFSKAYLAAILESRSFRLGKDLTALATKSLDKNHDHKLINRWVHNFIADGLI